MAISSEQQKRRNLLQQVSLALRYGRKLVHVENYQVGDIKSEHGVLVYPQAAVVGDIQAPKVVIAGLVFGYIAADEVTVETGGQVWGDVFSSAFHLEEGGKVHGWISSPDEMTANEAVSVNGRTADYQIIVPSEIEQLVPTSLPPGIDSQARMERLAIWRQLQAEAAVAIMARLELEKSFSSRVDEVAGESFSESSRLREEVNAYREERTALQIHIEELQGQLADGEERFKAKSAELVSVRGLLDDKNVALAELQSVFEQQTSKVASTEAARQELELKLEAATRQAEEMVERMSNLESALQGSLQHTAEQEEALIRWQELAEVTEQRADSLENELESLKLQLKESTQVVDMIRTRRDKLEKEWEKATTDLMEVAQDSAFIRAELDKKSEKLTVVEQERASLQKSLDILQQQIEDHPPEYEELLKRLETAIEANGEMKEQLEQAEADAQEYHDQWLWTKASLETTCSELDDFRQLANQYEEMIHQLQERIDDQESTVETWKNNMGRMTTLLYEAENKVKELELAVEEAKKAAAEDTEKEALNSEIRKQRLQIEAYEAEVTHIHGEIEKQSQRLADMQANLIERDITLRQANEAAEKQAAQVEQVKRLASKRIRDLEAELSKTQRKLKDLSVWLERRQKRGENGNAGITGELGTNS
ncbi:MAG: polymer-forming cytoskeletal protein [Candidatus Promineifilaceae bacterium]